MPQGRYSGFQVVGMIEWGQKSKPKKISEPKIFINPLKCPMQNYTARILRHYHKSSDCFEYPKNPYLNQATQKNTCQTFLPKFDPRIENSKPKKSFDHPCHLKSGVPPGGLRMLIIMYNNMLIVYIEYITRGRKDMNFIFEW